MEEVICRDFFKMWMRERERERELGQKMQGGENSDLRSETWAQSLEILGMRILSNKKHIHILQQIFL